MPIARKKTSKQHWQASYLMNLVERLLFTVEEFVGSFVVVVSANPKSIPDKLAYGSVVSTRCLVSYGRT